MTCHAVEERDLVAGYAHGRLTEPDQDAFEEHLLGCPACFDALQTYRVLHGVLARQALPARRAAWGTLSMWAGLAAAAGLAVAVAATLLSTRAGAPATSEAPQAAAPLAPALSAPRSIPADLRTERAERIQLLARFEAPRYEPPALRGAGDQSRQRFLSAMERYRSGDFAGAASALGQNAGDRAPAETLFYLGVCQLKLGQAVDAVATFRRVIESMDVLFEEDAHFFTAKALLMLGDVTGASAEARIAAGLKGDREGAAAALAAAIDSLPPN